jgi:hypothetical protein
MRIFVSHASPDLPLVQEFVALLKEIGVPNQEIFCTSLAGHGVPSGSDFKLYIREQFKESDIVIALISENYYASAFCMCELGAVWITANQRFFPFLVSPLEYKDLKAVLVGTQGSKVDKPTDLSELRDYIHVKLKGGGCSTPMWDESRDRFLSKIAGIIGNLPRASVVTRAEYDKTVKELAEYRTELKKQKAQLEKVDKELEEVSKLKDRTEVFKVSQKYKSEMEAFKALLNEARDQIKPLPLLVREALFHSVRDEDFSPNWNEWGDEPKLEIQRGRLRETGEEGDLLAVDQSDTDVADASASFEELAEFAAHASTELKKQYKADYGEKLDVRLRPFWHRWFKLSS